MLAILLLAAEKHKATFIAPIGIGLALFVAELLGVYYTGGSLNPARSFGPAVVLTTFERYHWIYWVGPALGATLAAGFYKMLKWLQYETVLGPEADADGSEERRAMLLPPLAEKPARTGSGLERMHAVTGPGMSDYLTAGDARAVFDLEHGGAFEARLERMEALLTQLVGDRASTGTGSPRASTFVDRPVANKPSVNHNGVANRA
jgi:aquaporin related protein